MYPMICLVLVILPIAGAIDCNGMQDGTYEVGCKSYATCSGGVSTIHDCPVGQVYDNSTKKCANTSLVTGICSHYEDCTGKADQKYADAGCKTFYTCTKGTFLGHNNCDSVLVFDEVKQTCNWPSEVAPPCGTKGQAGPGR